MALKLIYEGLEFTIVENAHEIPEPKAWIAKLRQGVTQGSNTVVDVMTTTGHLAFALTPSTQIALLVEPEGTDDFSGVI